MGKWPPEGAQFYDGIEIQEVREDKIIWGPKNDVLAHLLFLIAGVYLLYESIFNPDYTEIGRLFLLLIGGFLSFIFFIGFRESESITIDKKLQKVVIHKKSHIIEEIPFSYIKKIDTVYSPPCDVIKGCWYPVLTTIQGKSIVLSSYKDESSAERMIRKIRIITSIEEEICDICHKLKFCSEFKTDFGKRYLCTSCIIDSTNLSFGC